MKFETIGNVFPIIRNGANIKQDKVTDGYPITRIETIADGTVDLNRVGYASIHDENFSDFYLKENDILMSHINSVSHLGKVALVNGIEKKVIHGMNLLCLKADENKINPVYSFYFFKSPVFRSKIKRITKKSVNQASFNISNLKDIEIPLPPLPEQLHIASILSKVENLIAQRKESIRLLDEFLKCTFLEMFGDPATNSKGWELMTLKDVCYKIQDGTHFSPPITSEGIPYITAKHVRENIVDFWSNPWFISEENHKEIYKRCNPVIGDVLYIKDGATTGYAAINPYDFEFSMLSSLALLKPKTGVTNSEYLCAWLNNPNAKRSILTKMAGGAIKRLTLTKINALPILIPPFALQTQFAQIVEKTEALKSQYQQSLQELENLYGSLSQRAFKGELVKN